MNAPQVPDPQRLLERVLPTQEGNLASGPGCTPLRLNDSRQGPLPCSEASVVFQTVLGQGQAGRGCA